MATIQQISQELSQVSNALHQEYSDLERAKGEQHTIEQAVGILEREEGKISGKYKDKQRERDEELRKIQAELDTVQGKLNAKKEELLKTEAHINQVGGEIKKSELKQLTLQKLLKGEQDREEKLKRKV